MIAILNTTISVAIGLFAHAEVSLEEARRLVRGGYRSHVGHESTAQIASAILGVEVPFDRTPFDGAAPALCLKLYGRPPEGRVLGIEEIWSIGFSLRMLVPIAKLPRVGDVVSWIADDGRTVCRGTVTGGVHVSMGGWDGPGGYPPGSAVIDVRPLPGDPADDLSEQSQTVLLARVVGGLPR